MSYNTGIPLGTDTMLKSQQQIRTNFQAINAVFGTNHLSMNSEINVGRHNLLLMRPPSVNPALDPTTTANQIALYQKIVAGTPQLFFRPNSNQTPIQMTNSNLLTGIMSTAPVTYFLKQYSFLAGPFTIYGGLIKGATNGQVVPLTPATTLVYVGLNIEFTEPIVPETSTGAFPTSVSGSSFTISYAPDLGSPQNIFYLAIGV